MIIILHQALLSQVLTDSVRKQHEEGLIVKDNGGCFTCKILFSCNSCVFLVIFHVLLILHKLLLFTPNVRLVFFIHLTQSQRFPPRSL